MIISRISDKLHRILHCARALAASSKTMNAAKLLKIQSAVRRSIRVAASSV